MPIVLQTLTNVWPTLVMLMPAVMTPKVLLFANVILGILEMDLIVQVSAPLIRLFNFTKLFADHLVFKCLLFYRH